MDKFNFKKSVSCALIEYIKWILNARMTLLIILVASLYNFVIEPLIENADKMGEKLNILEPFIAVSNSGLVLLILPIVFLTLIADYPRIDGYMLFNILRVGRINWVAGQLIKLVLMAMSYIAFIFMGTIIPVCTRCFLGNHWSMVVTDFAKRFEEYSYNYGTQLIPENIYFQQSVYGAMVKSYLLVTAYLIILGLTLLVFSLLKKKVMGFVLCGAIISIGTALCVTKTSIMWVMPMANSIIWLHYTKYFRRPVIPLWISYLYFAFLIVILTMIAISTISTVSFDNVLSNE